MPCEVLAQQALALYLTHLAESGRKASTIRRARIAIGQAHAHAGATRPDRDGRIRTLERGIARTHGSREQGAAPLLDEQLARAVATLGHSPLAFTKVSALGVEEKRTNVIADFVDPPGALGDGFRVTARIIVWQSERVTKVPAGALFRCDESWCAFGIEGGRAVRRKVDVGHRNAREAEVLGGLRVGENVIGHPQNDIA